MSRTPSLPVPGPTLDLLWTTAVLVAAGAATPSAFLSVSAYEALKVSRAQSGGGVYAFEIDWSRDGVTVDLTQVVVVSNNGGVHLDVLASFARFRVKNTDALVAFGAHRTNVFAR